MFSFQNRYPGGGLIVHYIGVQGPVKKNCDNIINAEKKTNLGLIRLTISRYSIRILL